MCLALTDPQGRHDEAQTGGWPVHQLGHKAQGESPAIA